MATGNIEDWLKVIENKEEAVTQKYVAIFQLRQFENIEAARALMKGFNSIYDSDLLQHEVTYALGQMKIDDNEEIKEFLQRIFEDPKEYPVVRHEAGEALSNFSGFFDFKPLFEKYVNYDEVPEVRDTAILALKKFESYKNLSERYGSAYSGTKEPAAPFVLEDMEENLKEKMEKGNEIDFAQKCFKYIISEETKLFEKYRGLYFLRDLAEKQQSKEIVLMIAELLVVEGINQLFRHEICFVLGQVGHLGDLIKDIVVGIIKNPEENHIVRHEAISAFQAVSSDREYMKQYCEDKAPIVRDSAIVAYDMIEYWN